MKNFMQEYGAVLIATAIFFWFFFVHGGFQPELKRESWCAQIHNGTATFTPCPKLIKETDHAPK